MTPPTVLDSDALGAGAPCDQDDIFGPSRSFPPRSDRPRPSMISAKLRAKEERKKVMQLCTEKLEKIKDPDRNLRMSVCINNTFSRLQDEVRREKMMKNAPLPICPKPPTSEQKQRLLDKALESIDKELNAIGANMPSLEPDLLPELPTAVSASITMEVSYSSRISSSSFSLDTDKLDFGLRKLDNDRCKSKKRSFSEMEDCDVHEVLSQFYLPATPRLISAIEDDTLLDSVSPPSCERLSSSVKDNTRTQVAETPPHELTRVKPDFETGFEEILELDLNQNKSYFPTLNGITQEPSPKKMKCESTCPRNKYPQRKSCKSEFEIILDALRLDDGKDLCDREDLMYICGKSDKEAVSGRYSSIDSCGQAAYLRTNDQQATPFLGLPAELET